MNHLYRIATFLTIIVASGTAGHSQQLVWHQTKGPEGGAITVLGQNTQGTLFAGTTRKAFFRSTNDGASWENLAVGELGIWGPDMLFFTPAGDAFVHVEGAGLQRSTDNGSTWTPVLPNLDRMVSMAIDSSHNLLAASSLVGLFRSTDGGTTWNPVGDTVTREITAMGVTRDGAIIAGVGTGPYTFGSPGSFMRSTDGGTSWTRLDTFSLLASASSIIIVDDVILISTRTTGGTNGPGVGIYRSTDDGTTWSICDTAATGGDAAPLQVTSDGRIITGIYGKGIAASSDRGATWKLNPKTPEAISAIVARSDGSIFLGTSTSGIYRSTGDPAVWVERNSGIINQQVYALAATRDHLLAATATGKLLRTSDRGEHWETVADDGAYVTLCTTPSGTIIAARNSQFLPGRILRSTDNGTTWSASGVDSFPTQFYINDLAVDVDGTLYLATAEDGVWRSIDDGINWRRMASSFTDQINAIAVGNGYLFVLQRGSQVFVNRIGSPAWEHSSIPSESGEFVYALAAHASGSLFVGTTAGVWRSTDYGKSWQKRSQGIDSQFVRDLFVAPDGAIYASLDAGGIYRSIDNGENWSDIGTGLVSRYVIAIAADSSGYLYAGTLSDGVFRGEKTAGLDVDRSIIEQGASSLSISPNPVTSAASVSFDLPAACDVRIEIFDLQGGNVARLPLQRMEAGSHAVSLAAGELPSGVYLFRLEAGAVRLSRMIVVTR